jgi:1-acyl-sn-glycerol-3-phosphate acyltransferase
MEGSHSTKNSFMRFYLAVPFVVILAIFYSIAGVIATLVDRSGGLYHVMFQQWSKATLWLFGIRVRMRGAENLDPGCNYVFLPNHSSYLDIPVLGASMPQPFRLIFKEELTKVPIWGWALLVSPHIRIKRTDARDAMGSIERAAREIHDGASVVIFPEGTRTATGELGEFKRGGVLLATKSGVPLVPVAIQGTYPLLSRHDRRVRPGSVELVIGKPIPNPGNLDRERERALQAAVRSQLVDMLAEMEPAAKKMS